MAGNVSEWVDSSYEPTSYNYTASFNPNIKDRENPLKVVRGGSWKDVQYFLKLVQEIMRIHQYQGVTLDLELCKITLELTLQRMLQLIKKTKIKTII